MKTNCGRTWWLLCLSALIGLLVFHLPGARGQGAGNATLTGTIEDPNGSVIVGAQVVIKNVETGVARTLTTNDEGLYAAPLLQPGTYEIRASKQGFAELIRKDIHLAVGQTLAIDLRLPVKSAQETVTVTGEVPLV